MKNLIFYILIVISIQVSAQEKKEAMIDVVGSAKISVRPDVGILNIRLSETKSKMNEAVTALSKKANYYLKVIEDLGFEKEKVKTTNFSISKNRVYVNRQYIDSGHIAAQNIKLEFPYNKKMLAKILDELSESKEQVDFSFSFKLSDKLKKDIQLQVIDKAINDANVKSKRIASAAEVNLVKIKKISYGHSGNVNSPMRYSREASYASDLGNSGGKSYNFTPDDIIISDNIKIIWIVE